ncbi:cation diffusion facilitator family transporter [Azospirillum sp. sgz301742]
MADHSSTRVVVAALIGNALIAVTKFVASAFTGSAAMFSEAIHSVVDSGNQMLLLHGIRRARRPATPEHPFGYGREVYFWAFVVAILIFGIGAGLSLYEGWQALRNPQPPGNPWVNLVVLGIAFVFEGGAWWVAMREFRRSMTGTSLFAAVRRSKNPAVFVVLFEDSAAIIGLVLAAAGILAGMLTGNPVYDALASIAIGVVLAVVAALLAYESKGLLIGEAAERRVIDGIRRIVGEERRVKRPIDVLTMHMGPDDVLLNLSVEFADDLTAHEVEDTVCTLEGRIRRQFPQIRRVFVEAESLRERRDRPLPPPRQARAV